MDLGVAIVFREGSKHSVVIHTVRTEQFDRSRLDDMASNFPPQGLNHVTSIVRLLFNDIVGDAHDGVFRMQPLRLKAYTK